MKDKLLCEIFQKMNQKKLMKILSNLFLAIFEEGVNGEYDRKKVHRLKN